MCLNSGLLVMQVRKDSGGATLRYMPVWRIDELEACRSSCYPFIAPEDVQSKYAHCGGSARFVLSSLGYKAELEEALQSYDIERAIQAVTSGRGSDTAICHRLLHIFPAEDFQTYSVGFASQQVCYFASDFERSVDGSPAVGVRALIHFLSCSCRSAS